MQKSTKRTGSRRGGPVRPDTWPVRTAGLCAAFAFALAPALPASVAAARCARYGAYA